MAQMETKLQAQIIALARECLDTPFKHQGRLCGVAMDCAGIPAHIFQGLNLPYNDGDGYPRRPFRGMLETILGDQPSLEKIRISEIQPGDLLLFRISTAPQHIGLYTGQTIIHAFAPVGKVTEQPFAPWKSQITHAYRFKI